jgi:glycosyltransferase involved in cell wall biosynthesis
VTPTTEELPATSVVVPVYNAQETLDACIDSLLGLDYPKDRLELVVVDNGSTDATPEILARRAGDVRVLRERKRGPAAARNAGVRAATGDVVAFTDADCVVDPRWLLELVAALGDRGDRIVGGTIRATRPANPAERFGEQIHDHHVSIEEDRPPYVITMNCSASLHGLRAHAQFDESFRRCEDADLSYRLFQDGWSFAFAPDAVVYHRNERTLAGLFREGIQHGFYSMQVRKAHHALMRACGNPRVVYGAAYRDLVVNLWRAVRGPARQAAVCMFVFSIGRVLGRLAGAIRFRYAGL